MPFKTIPPLYFVWQSMLGRCRNPNFRQWNDYGGRGITVCERWHDYHAFAADMGERPPGYTLERIDNSLGYSPENCRWATRKEQQRNRRAAKYVTIDGVEYRAIELADMAGVKTDTIIARAERGLSYEDVIRPDKIHNLSGLAAGGKASGAKKRTMTHCKRGHEFTEDNTSFTLDGYRRCKACHREKERDRLAAIRAAKDAR